MTFHIEKKIPENLAYTGIRAHYIQVLPENTVPEREPNCAVMAVSHLMEQQFESEIILDCKGETKCQMRLLMDKKTAYELSRREKLAIRIPEEALLLLHA